MSPATISYSGGCACRSVRYQLNAPPIFVHCCHCSWCQRETGSAFAVNALIETHEIELTTSAPEEVLTPSASGRGQRIMRCEQCRVAVWSRYNSDTMGFVRVGTLDDPSAMPPDIHIYTSTAQPWVQIPGDVPRVDEYYSARDFWPETSLNRLQALKR